MFQHELKPAAGSKQSRKRVGRGNASGQGTYAGRGCKGQNARSGGGVRPGFEGGQTPLYQRLPKLKGFKNRFRVEFQEVNVAQLAAFEGKTVTNIELHKAGLITKADQPVKLLGNGEIKGAVTVQVQKASASAIAKVEKAGGKVELLVKEDNAVTLDAKKKAEKTAAKKAAKAK